MYIINLENDSWIIISGDKRVEPILAVDESGKEELHLKTMNNGVFTWLDDMAGSIYDLKQNRSSSMTEEYHEFWFAIQPQKILPPDGLPSDGGYFSKVLINVETQNLPSHQVGPLIQTKWGQRDPFNTCVPFGELYQGVYTRCPTGCVAVATAQLMYYGHFKSNNPSWMYSQGSCAGYSWDGYKNYAFSFSEPSSTVWNVMRKNGYGTSGANEVAILMGYVGFKAEMEYARNGSGASSDKVPGVFSDFGITCNKQDFNLSKTLSNLNNNKPVYSSAFITRKDHKFLGIHLYYTYKDGHAWIIDGYESKRMKYTYTYRWEWVDNGGPIRKSLGTTDVEYSPDAYAAVYDGKIEIEERISTTQYLIMNWGWYGSGDSGRYFPTSTWDGGLGDFKYKRSIICDFSF